MKMFGSSPWPFIGQRLKVDRRKCSEAFFVSEQKLKLCRGKFSEAVHCRGSNLKRNCVDENIWKSPPVLERRA